MLNKLNYCVVFVVLLCFGSNSLAAVKWYEPYTSILHWPKGIDWSDPNGWFDELGTNPAGPPQDYDEFDGNGITDVATINTGVANVYENVSAPYTATPWQLYVGSNKYLNDPCSPFYDPNAPAPLPAGVLNVYSRGIPGDPDLWKAFGLMTYNIYMGALEYGEGVLNIYGTAFSHGFRCAFAPYANSTVNIMDGGRLESGWWGTFLGVHPPEEFGGGDFTYDFPADARGVARINLKGDGNWVVWGNVGTVPYGKAGINMLENSHIDIESGLITIYGDQLAQIQGYIANGWISAYGGRYDNCGPSTWTEFHDPDTYTYIASQGPGCPCRGYKAGDINSDCYVNMIDVAELANTWLECSQPAEIDPNCGLLF
jgi:hypothetical protein